MAERESRLSLAPFARCSATLCRLFRVHRDRATRISVSRPSELAAASAAPSRSSVVHASFPTCAVWPSCAREHTRALRAHVRHFSFFAFTSSPTCVNALTVSAQGVKAFALRPSPGLHTSGAAVKDENGRRLHPQRPSNQAAEAPS